MTEFPFNRMNITMKDGREYLGMIMIPNVTSVSIDRLAVQDPTSNHLLVINWADVREAYMYEDNDE